MLPASLPIMLRFFTLFCWLSSCCILPDSTVRLSTVIPVAAASCITVPAASSFRLLFAPVTVMPLLPRAILALVEVITLSAPNTSVLLLRFTLLPAVMLPAPSAVMLPVVTFTSLPALILLAPPAATVPAFRLTSLPAVMLPAPLAVMLPVVTFTSPLAVILLAPLAVTVPAFRLTSLPLTVTSPSALMLPLPAPLPKFTLPSRFSLAFPVAEMLSTTRPVSFSPAPCR